MGFQPLDWHVFLRRRGVSLWGAGKQTQWAFLKVSWDIRILPGVGSIHAICPYIPYFPLKSLRCHTAALGPVGWDLWKKWVLVSCYNLKWPVGLKKMLKFWGDSPMRKKPCFPKHGPKASSIPEIMLHTTCLKDEALFHSCWPVTEGSKPLLLLQIFI